MMRSPGRGGRTSRWLSAGAGLAALALVSLATVASGTPPTTAAPVDPKVAGLDSFPSKGHVTVQIPGAKGERDIELSSQGLPDTVVQRGALNGSTIDTEIVSMQLQGTDPQLGPMLVMVGHDLGLPPSRGQVQNVQLGPDGSFGCADSFFDVFTEIYLRQSNVVAQNDQPLRMTARICRLPPNVPTPTPAGATTSTDHFKCYKVSSRSRFRKRTVGLKDQFEDATAKAVTPVLLCNPVQKNGTQIQDSKDHLVCYKLKQKGTFSKKVLGIRNQFGAETVDAVARETLCLPSRKQVLKGKHRKVPKPAAGRALDHFKCYKVTPRKQGQALTVQLSDQFESRKTQVGRPKTICNPVQKTVGKRVTKIRNLLTHLVFYPIDKRSVRRVVLVRNQFGTQVLRVLRTDSLGLPSHKTNCSEYAEQTKIALMSQGQQIATVNKAIHIPYEGDPNGDCP